MSAVRLRGPGVTIADVVDVARNASTVELDAEAYRQLVLDEWDWTHRFKSITATYGKGGVG